MSIRLKQHYATTGSGLGYQISSYLMMRSLETKTGQDWIITQDSFKALRNTFKDLKLNIQHEDDDIINNIELDDEVGFAELCNVALQIEAGASCEYDLYPTGPNITDDMELFEQIKHELLFRDDIYSKCKEFRDKFDGEVISMHLRRGDFKAIENGMFLCGTDYFINALDQLPKDLPVLVFTNDKDDVITNHELVASNPSRFTFITDLYNNNEFINCDVGQELDRLVDISGDCKFDYKRALASMVQNNLGRVPEYKELIGEMKDLVKELSPEYKQKLKTHTYNYSLDLCLMTMCNYHIMSNSTYSMWATELSQSKKIIYPKYWMQGHNDEMELKSDLGDFNQTAALAPQIVGRENYIGIANPDSRSFTIFS